MSYNPNPSVVTGQTLAASAWNTYVKGNIDTLWPYAAAGDLAIASGADTLTRLPVGTDGQIMKVVSGSPAWAAPSSGISLADVYPVGSVYISTSSTNPATIFGLGTWSAIQGRMLIGADGTYSAGTTGGAATVTLTAAEMPAHTHTQNSHNHTQDPHSHTVGMTLAYYRDGSSSNDQRGIAGSINTSSTTATNQAATATNQLTGGGGAHDNMPPWIAVYIWTRTA